MHEPTPHELFEEVRKLNDRVSLLEHRHVGVSTAFPINDLDKPDYDGHRRAHLKLIAESQMIDSYKEAATKKVIGIAITVLLTLLVSGVLFTLRREI